jgi:hypothetical protein
MTRLTPKQRTALAQLKREGEMVGWRIAASATLRHLNRKGFIENCHSYWETYNYSMWKITPDGIAALEASA